MTYYGPKELAASFRTVRKNTLTIAEEFTDAQYAFRPAPGTRSVAEILAHIVSSTTRVYESNATERKAHVDFSDFAAWTKAREDEERGLQTKARIVEALRTGGERWAAWLEGTDEQLFAEIVTFPPSVTPPTKSRFELILGAKEHEMHHRAQLMLIQRLLGIVPHLTRERQARMAAAAGSRPA